MKKLKFNFLFKENDAECPDLKRPKVDDRSVPNKENLDLITSMNMTRGSVITYASPCANQDIYEVS